MTAPTTERWQVDMTAAERDEDQLVPASFAEWAPRLVAADDQPGDRVLDIACGTGVVARQAAERVGPTGRVTKLDLNPGMLALASRLRPDLAWRRGDAVTLPFPDASIGRVLCQFGVMSFQDRAAALPEMRRVATPDGTGAIAVWAACEQSEVFVRLGELLARFDAPQAVDMLRSPFVLGDVAEVVA